MTTRLIDPPYMAFPFTITSTGAKEVQRKDHIRAQIEQVMFTAPGERVFRSDFGVGLRNLLFEPNSQVLWTLVKKRIQSTLAEALQGEVAPHSIEVSAEGNETSIEIIVSYTLSRLGYQERQLFIVEE